MIERFNEKRHYRGGSVSSSCWFTAVGDCIQYYNHNRNRACFIIIRYLNILRIKVSVANLVFGTSDYMQSKVIEPFPIALFFTEVL